MANVRVGYTWFKDVDGKSVRVLNYTYKLSGIVYQFHLLSEVGEPRQAAMRAALREYLQRHNAHLEPRDFLEYPHFAEVLVSN
jgi:hypothetical protein